MGSTTSVDDVSAGPSVFVDEFHGLLVDHGIDDLVKGFVDDGLDLLNFPTGDQGGHVVTHAFHLIVISARCEKDELRVGASDDRFFRSTLRDRRVGRKRRNSTSRGWSCQGQRKPLAPPRHRIGHVDISRPTDAVFHPQVRAGILCVGCTISTVVA